MGAGIPTQVPGVLDLLAEHRHARYRLDVKGALPTDNFEVEFEPHQVIPLLNHAPLKRPKFLAIIASALLAKVLTTRSSGKVDGFVVEGPTAGGHNAPPRGKLQLDSQGQPIYGERDIVEYDKISELGLPFWIAGSYASPLKLQEALALGAAGIQVGTAFALSEESGLDPDYKRQLRMKAYAGELEVLTDPRASPSTFPFKVAQLEGTLSEEPVYAARPRLCDVGRLQELYRQEDGSLGMRCASEPVDEYLAKGGALEDTVGRKCLCNALLANIGLGQTQPNGYHEQPLFTLGDDTSYLRCLMAGPEDSYSALDVLDFLRLGRPVALTPVAAAVT